MKNSFKIKGVGLTDVGQVRSINQDSFLVNHDDQLYIVADGMGGHVGGEIASQLCITEIGKFLSENIAKGTKLEHPEKKICSLMIGAVNHASTKIYERALEDPDLKGMGTTATVCRVIDDHAYIAHVGDSRLYLVRCGFIYQITDDHSLVGEQVRAGLLTPQEAELHHLRNVITRSVGFQEEEDVDTTILKLEDGDLFMMSSDGLHGLVKDIEISSLLGSDGLASAQKMLDLANQRGGEDNITVITLKLQAT